MGEIHDVYAERKYQEVMKDTWGHLAPEPRKKYYGTILIAACDNGDTVIIREKFPELDGSPWQAEDFSDWLCRLPIDLADGIYQFDGWYMKYKNDNYHIGSKLKKAEITIP